MIISQLQEFKFLFQIFYNDINFDCLHVNKILRFEMENFTVDFYKKNYCLITKDLKLLRKWDL